MADLTMAADHGSPYGIVAHTFPIAFALRYDDLFDQLISYKCRLVNSINYFMNFSLWPSLSTETSQQAKERPSDQMTDSKKRTRTEMHDFEGMSFAGMWTTTSIVKISNNS